MAITNNVLPTNFPTKPPKTNNSFAFPNDLQASGRDFAMSIAFSKYTSDTNTGTIKSVPSGSILLPLPKRINDVQTISWEDISATSAGYSLASAAGKLASSLSEGISSIITSTISGSLVDAISAGSPIASHYAGQVINPMLWMLFKQPNFKEFTFQWTLAPNNAQESQTLIYIINLLKKNSLPSLSQNALVMNYPNIANIFMLPSSDFTFEFKPCAITSVQVDYTAGGQPSFFKGTNAPTIVNLTISVKEIELWTQEDFA